MLARTRSRSSAGAGRRALPPVAVRLGERAYLQPELGEAGAFLTEKGRQGKLDYQIDLPEAVNAPVAPGQTLGVLRVTENGTLLRELPLTAGEAAEKKSLWQIFREALFSLAEDRKYL